MNKYLFLFTIGPVQSFIAQARKTRDLYAGSSLLSDLIEKTIEKLKDIAEKPKLIFPAENIKSKPNRFVAMVNTDNVEKVGEELEKFVRDEFENIAKSALNTLNDRHKIENLFTKQIKDFLQIYWVALPLDKDEDYYKVYPKLEGYLGSVKNVRVFNQLEETGRKCSVCGERNVLVYRRTDDEENNKGPKKRKDGLLRKLYIKENEVVFFEPKDEDRLILRKGEGLCAVCLTKRLYKKEKFPSTAKIAAMDWLKDLPKDKLDAYEKLFNNFDDELYFEENLREEYLKKYDHYKDEQSLSKARKQLNELYRKFGKPKKYYVLFKLDGDRMGQWLSGEFLDNKGKNNLEYFHKKMSEELGKYAKKVSSIIHESNGKVVYAGGDDVMAFVNLKDFLPLMQELRIKFPSFEDLTHNGEKSEIKGMQRSTASLGVVIAHYKTPLSEVLKWAREMEHEAKEKEEKEEKGGRDAFAIAVLKHSGEIHKTVWKWNLDKKEEEQPITILKDLIKELKDAKEGFSHTFIKYLNEEFAELDKIEEDWLNAELKRLLDRACQIKGDKEKKKEKVKEWQEKLCNLYKSQNRKSQNESQKFEIMDVSEEETLKKANFLSFLNISDFLARRIK